MYDRKQLDILSRLQVSQPSEKHFVILTFPGLIVFKIALFCIILLCVFLFGHLLVSALVSVRVALFVHNILFHYVNKLID